MAELLRLKDKQIGLLAIGNEHVSTDPLKKIAESKLALAFPTTTLNGNIEGVKSKKILAFIESLNLAVGAVGSVDATAAIIAASFYDTYNGSSSVTGVITTAPNNKVYLRDNVSKAPIEDATGKDVYGRLTNAGAAAQFSVDFAAMVNPGDAANLNSQAVTFQSAAGQDFYFWWNNELGGTDPMLPGFGIEISGVQNINDGPQAAAITFNELSFNPTFTADFNITDNGSYFTITNKVNGDTNPPGTTLGAFLTVTPLAPGSDDAFTLTFYSGSDTPYAFTAPAAIDILFPESYNLHELPFTAFTTGVAYTDALSALPTHTHAISEVTGLQGALDAKVTAATLALVGGAATVGADDTGFTSISGSTVQAMLSDIDGKIGSGVPTNRNGIDLSSQVQDVDPAVFVVPDGKYVAGTLAVFVQGSKQQRTVLGQEAAGQFIETNPAAGEFTFVTDAIPDAGYKVAADYDYLP